MPSQTEILAISVVSCFVVIVKLTKLWPEPDLVRSNSLGRWGQRKPTGIIRIQSPKRRQRRLLSLLTAVIARCPHCHQRHRYSRCSLSVSSILFVSLLHSLERVNLQGPHLSTTFHLRAFAPSTRPNTSSLVPSSTLITKVDPDTLARDIQSPC